MNRIASLARRVPRQIGRLPTMLRTLRWLRPRQARAQLHHALFGVSAPRRLTIAPPVQAIAAPATAFLPPPPHVRGPGGGRIELLSTAFRLGDRPDWSSREHGPLFAYHLHQHEYLRTPAFSPTQRTACLIDWIERHPSGVGWDPHPISLRLLCWGKLLTTAGALDLDADSALRLHASMADQAETLARGLEHRLQANHLLSNLIAVVWAGLLLEGEVSSKWRDLGATLIREIDLQIHPDGGHEERSPMYHALLLESLLDLLNLCRADPERAPIGLVESLEAAASRMLVALGAWTHPDGRIALFADSAFDISAEPATLVDYATRLGVEGVDAVLDSEESVVLPQSGYVCLRAPEAWLLASTSGPAPAHQPGHAHCDALAFELSLGGRRVVTDTGLFEYQPGARRDHARSTASHATLQIDGQEQAELWAAHRIGGRPVVELVGWDGARCAEASCRGWSRRRTTHRRLFRVGEREAEILDQVEGARRRLRLSLPLDPAWQVELDARASRATATLREPDGAGPIRVEIELPTELRWQLERGAYYPSFGREVERDVLVGLGEKLERGITRLTFLGALL